MEGQKSTSSQTYDELFASLVEKNKLNISDKKVFETASRAISNRKEREILQDFLQNKYHFDLNNITYKDFKQIHFIIFDEIYFWAGKDRNQCGLKGKFCKYILNFCEGNELENYSDEIFSFLRKIYKQNRSGIWTQKPYKKNLAMQIKIIKFYTNKAFITKNLALLWGKLNFLHPFREGNGRVTRIFMIFTAKRFGFTLTFPERREQVIALNRALRNNYTSLEDILLKNLY